MCLHCICTISIYCSVSDEACVLFPEVEYLDLIKTGSNHQIMTSLASAIIIFYVFDECVARIRIEPDITFRNEGNTVISTTPYTEHNNYGIYNQ
jgi:hypothetical protein